MSKLSSVYHCTIRIADGSKRFFVAFSDVKGIPHEIEVSQDVYHAFQEFKRDDKRQQHQFERYIEFHKLSDEHLHSRAFYQTAMTDDTVMVRFYSNMLQEALKQLSESQRRRFILHYEHNLSYRKIAQIENCSDVSALRSVKRAKAKLVRILEKYFEEI